MLRNMNKIIEMERSQIVSIWWNQNERKWKEKGFKQEPEPL